MKQKSWNAVGRTDRTVVMDFGQGLNRDALFADETTQFRYPYEAEAGDEITFRFRTLKDNADTVRLIGRGVRRTMEKAFTEGLFDYYETKLVIGNEIFRYCFEIEKNGEFCVYTKLGAGYASYATERSFFSVCPGFATPDWAKGAVFYQIFTDRFRNGDPKNDVLSGEYFYLGRPVVHAESWEEGLQSPDVHRFYGGDLPGVMEKLDYLKYLGVEVIYFNPIFVSPSNHKYDTEDYEHIDPHLVGFVRDEGALLPEGETDNRKAERYICRVTDPDNLKHADDYFAKLIEEAHRRGIKVVIDGVFNHCGSFNKWMDREGVYSAGGSGSRGDGGKYLPGAYGNAESPYRNHFIFDGASTTDYVGWWRHETLPKLNYEHSEELTKDIMDIAAKWLANPYNADGWRLDVAADLGTSDRFNHRFWEHFRRVVKEENPNALILAEHYGDPGEWLTGEEWDAVMNYDAFMEPVSYFLTGMEKHSDEYDGFLHGNGRAFFTNLLQAMSRLPHQALAASTNQLSNHDHSRFLTRTNGRVGRLETCGAAAASEGVSYPLFRLGAVMQFTLPGAPALYYGDEAGTPGWTDPDSRRTFPWGRENWDLVSFHKDLIHLYKRCSCLRRGSFKPLSGDSGYVAYGRFDETLAAAVVINQSPEERCLEIPVWQLGIPEDAEMDRVLETAHFGYNIGVLKKSVQDGTLRLNLAPESSQILVYRY